jgi:cysteine synthase A
LEGSRPLIISIRPESSGNPQANRCVLQDFAGTMQFFRSCSCAWGMNRIYPVISSSLKRSCNKPVTNPNHRIQGGGYSMPDLPLLNKDLVDGYLEITDDEAIKMARRLAKEEGIFAGFSAGANTAAAVKLLNSTCKGQSIAVLLSDSGLKYLSTDLWA